MHTENLSEFVWLRGRYWTYNKQLYKTSVQCSETILKKNPKTLPQNPKPWYWSYQTRIQKRHIHGITLKVYNALSFLILTVQSSRFSLKYRKYFQILEKAQKWHREQQQSLKAQNGNKNSFTLGLSWEGRKVQKISKVMSINKVKTTAESNRLIQRH